MTFHSKTIGGKFGRGRAKLEAWECVCGETNSSWLVNCRLCNVPKTLAQQALETPDK